MKNSASSIISGVIVPTITFFEPDGTCPSKPNGLLLEHILLNGGEVIFLMGSTGEGLFFKDKADKKSDYLKNMKNKITELEKEYSKHIPVIIGVYGNSADEVLADAQNVLNVWKNIEGLVIPPPTDRELDPSAQYEFYSEILKKIAPVRVYLYNNPGRFAGTQLDGDAIKRLKEEYDNLSGIKDSSSSLGQKRTYLELIDENFGVSCGKEGMIGTFLTLVPPNMADFAGIVPSIANIVNTCSKIVRKARDNASNDEVIELQKYLNEFRNRIYDTRKGQGKAQRGLKYAFKVLYGNKIPDIPLYVMPELELEFDEQTKKTIENEVANRIDSGDISKVS